MKPSPAQLGLLADAVEAGGVAHVNHMAGNHTSFRTAAACRARGWGTIPHHFSDSLFHFAANEVGAKLAAGEVARREEERRLAQERLRAEDEAFEAKCAEERAEYLIKDAGVKHRRGFSGQRSAAPLSAATELQADDLRNETAAIFLGEIERAPERPQDALDAAFRVMLGLLDEAVHAWVPADLDRHDFPEAASSLRAIAPIRTWKQALAFEAQAKSIASDTYDLARKTNDQHLASSACHVLNRLKTVCESFRERDEWGLRVVARTLGEVAREAAHADAARRALVRFMLEPSTDD